MEEIASLTRNHATCDDARRSNASHYRPTIENWEKLIALRPDYYLRPVAMFHLARVYMRVGEREKAKQTLRKFIAAYPEMPEAGISKELLKRLDPK